MARRSEGPGSGRKALSSIFPPHGHLRFPGIPARDEWELRNRVFTPAEVAALDNHQAAGNSKRFPQGGAVVPLESSAPPGIRPL